MHLPTFTGKIFCSTYKNFHKKKLLPTTPLPHYHPLWSLWQDHLTSLQSQDANCLIDALVAVWLQNPQWTSEMAQDRVDSERHQMRQLLSENPPDVLILNDVPLEDWSYGAFLKGQKSRRFIFLNEEHVNLWQNAEEDVEHLELTALLRAALDHELGHWVQVIATVNGHLSANNTLTKWKDTWGETEAGEWVEYCSRGGIINHDSPFKTVFFVTGPGRTYFQDISSAELEQYRSSTAFPSKIAPRNAPLKIKLAPKKPSLKTKTKLSLMDTNCRPTLGMIKRGCGHRRI